MKEKRGRRVNSVVVGALSDNGWYRNFRAWVLRLEHRLQWDRPRVAVADGASRLCPHCKRHYLGNYCPHCGMPSRWNRFSWKLLLLNFLDIWGLGNRPMFRTIRDLFWRPGFMMRDYLRGHHLSYFPPFKLLALLTVLLIFLGWALDVKLGESVFLADSLDKVIDDNVETGRSSVSQSVIAFLQVAEGFLNEHILYRILSQNVILVLVVWLAFRRVGKLNLVETFFSQIYINCQFLMIGVVALLVTREFSLGYVFPYAIPNKLNLLIPALLSCNFHQLYGVSWKSSVLRVLLVSIGTVAVYIAAVCLLVLLSMSVRATVVLTVLTLVFAGISWVIFTFISRQKPALSRTVYVMSLGYLGPMALGLLFGFGILENESMKLGLIGAGGCVAFAVLACYLMIAVYKKTHRTWLALVSLAVVHLMVLSLYLIGS